MHVVKICANQMQIIFANRLLQEIISTIFKKGLSMYYIFTMFKNRGKISCGKKSHQSDDDDDAFIEEIEASVRKINDIRQFGHNSR